MSPYKGYFQTIKTLNKIKDKLLFLGVKNSSYEKS